MLLILAGVSINLVLGENGIIAKTKDAREQTQRAEAKDDVDLAVANMQIEASQRTMTQEEKRQSIENELKKIRPESTVTINGDVFKAKHKGYEFEISDSGEISVNEPFEASEWDKTAAPEDVFIWASDEPTSEDYGKVVGYKPNVDNYPVLRYPSRCTSVGVDNDYITGTYEETKTIRSYTKNIKKIELPETVIEIDGAFGGGNSGYHFSAMKEINIPDGIVNIGSGTFYDCTSLSSIIIPDGVTSIGSGAFRECTSLSSITIPNSVISIGEDAFEKTAWYNNQPDGLIYAGKVAYKYKGTMPENTELEIKEGTKSISRSAFYRWPFGCKNLISITIPNSVISIGSQAFSDCTNLSSVTIPDSVEIIEQNAFKNVPHIYINLPDTGSPSGAPWGAGAIVTITDITPENPKPDVPFNAEEWDKKAAPEDVFIWANDDPTSEDYGKVVGYKANVENYPILRYPSRCTSVGVDTRYITGTSEEVETIRSYTKNIKKVELPETVTEIGDNAYNKHSFDSMKEINLPNGVKSIGYQAFYGCTSLSNIMIPNGVKSIGYEAFHDCTSLSGIAIPNSVTSIGFNAFYGVSTVYYCGRLLGDAPWGALAMN